MMAAEAEEATEPKACLWRYQPLSRQVVDPCAGAARMGWETLTGTGCGLSDGVLTSGAARH